MRILLPMLLALASFAAACAAPGPPVDRLDGDFALLEAQLRG